MTTTIEKPFAVVSQMHDRQHGHAGTDPKNWFVFTIGRETGRLIYRNTKPKTWPDPRHRKEEIVARFSTDVEAHDFLDRCRAVWNDATQRMMPLEVAAADAYAVLRQAKADQAAGMALAVKTFTTHTEKA